MGLLLGGSLSKGPLLGDSLPLGSLGGSLSTGSQLGNSLTIPRGFG